MARHLTTSRLLLLITLTASIATLLAAEARAQVRPTVRVGETYMAAQLVSRVEPIYPPMAKQAGIQGAVVMKAVISKSGEVENLVLITGHPMLAPAAIEAVKRWKYKPFLLNGQPIEVVTQVTVNFTLADKKTEATGVVGDMPGGMPAGDVPVAVPQTDMAGVPQRVRISSGVAQGLLIKKVPPVYPADAKDQRIQGVVVLRVKIDREGNVIQADLVSGHPLLAPSAIEAVKQWKYKPYLLNGNPVEVETQVQVNFTLVG